MLRARVVAVSLVAGGALAGCQAPAPEPASRICPDAQLIFARGSGQELNDREARAWHDEVTSSLRDVGNVMYHELGSDEASEERYPAVAINRSVTLAADGMLSATPAMDYAKSVQTGVEEFARFVYDVNRACPSTTFVVGGYSQGAQVVTKGLSRVAEIAPSALGDIGAVTVFGDPSSWFPEGQGDDEVPACTGEYYSPWRFNVTDCRTSTGLLGGREGYVPKSVANKVAAWCEPGDVVCGANQNLRSWDPHFTYAREGGPVNEAARWIAATLGHGAPLPPRFPVSHYFGRPDTELRFRPHGAHGTRSFDVQGDGTHETRSEADVRHTYGEVFEGPVTVIADNGVAATYVTVSEELPTSHGPQPGGAVDVSSVGDDVVVSWDTGGLQGVGWIVWVDHYPIGLSFSNTPVTVKGLDRTRDHTVGVSSAWLNGQFSEQRTTTVFAQS